MKSRREQIQFARRLAALTSRHKGLLERLQEAENKPEVLASIQQVLQEMDTLRNNYTQ